MQFKENLPEQCPPSEAYQPNGEEVVYRLGHIENDYSTDDFRSHWDKFPQNRTQYTQKVGECRAKSLSVFSTEEDARNACRLPSPRSKNKFKSLIAINLQPTDGLLMQTGIDKAHYSIWVSCTFASDRANIQVIPL